MTKTQYVDIAVNLVGSELETQLPQVITEAQHAEVTHLIVIGSHLEESRQVVTLSRQYPQSLSATVGVHPHYARLWDQHSAQQLITLANQETVVAIGECGLDYNRNFSPRADQLAAFEAQLELAAQLNKPIYMHCREAHDDFIRLVSQYRSRLGNAVLHCFTGSKDELHACLDLDLHIGITGWVCDERRGQELANIVADIPDDRIMLETDSPYLLPRILTPKPKSRTNYPKYLPVIAAKVAELRKQSLSDFTHCCYRNSVQFFNLEPRL